MFDVSPAPHPRTPLRAVAFFLPQFHPIAENDRFWGAGFTEWRNVVRARPRFRGHEQPHLPGDLGFYDLRLPETRHAQIALARKAGLSGFCWYHYWFNGRRVLDRPFNDMLADPASALPFLLCWANENWTRAWDGGHREVLIRQTYSDADTAAHARALVPAFMDRRAIRIDGRPVFAVWNTDEIPSPERWSDRFRGTLAREGIDPYLIRVERYLDRDTRPPAALGFDAAVDFQPFSRTFRAWQLARPELSRALPARALRRAMAVLHARCPRDTRYDMAAYRAFATTHPGPDYLRFPGVCPSWDNAARRPRNKAITFLNTDPAAFRASVAETVARFHPPSPDENLLFVNAWNEWAEGCHLEPCLRHGHAWIDALSAGLSATAGLPDEPRSHQSPQETCQGSGKRRVPTASPSP